jgi:aminoglycoside 2'-N-acetyltransferase I
MRSVIERRTAHTADLDDEAKTAIRALMDAAFDGVSDDTFDNVLGGMHALVFEDGQLIGHASVVQRRLLHGGRPLRTGYIEGVAVRPDRRRRGYGDAMMTVLERIVRSGYHLGALGASEDGARLYRSRGWQLWRGLPSATLSHENLILNGPSCRALARVPSSGPRSWAGLSLTP